MANPVVAEVKLPGSGEVFKLTLGACCEIDAELGENSFFDLAAAWEEGAKPRPRDLREVLRYGLKRRRGEWTNEELDELVAAEGGLLPTFRLVWKGITLFFLADAEAGGPVAPVEADAGAKKKGSESANG